MNTKQLDEPTYLERFTQLLGRLAAEGRSFQFGEESLRGRQVQSAPGAASGWFYEAPRQNKRRAHSQSGAARNQLQLNLGAN